VHALNDGDVIEIAGLKITALGTPGHARHHMVYRLEDVAFTGDQAGICLEGYSHIHMPTPPPEFDLEAWVASVDRLRQQNYKRLYLTHFGRIDQVEEHWSGVETLLREATAFVGRRLAENASRETIIREYAEMEEKRMQDSALDLRGRSLYADLGPAEMSVDGLIRYWKKRELQPASYFSGRGVLI
jgi:glyoxylase-like metal-dependent hydrolase (beta-lactamase superfamily II)